MDPVAVAVIGAGSIAGYHLEGLASVPQATVRAVASRSLESAERLAGQFAVIEATRDIEALLARPDIDAVVITTPDDTHETLAIAAASAGKAVLLQKPMAPTSAACRRIIAAAAHSGVDLQVSFMHRYFEEVRAARALLEDGALGEITSLRLRNATPGPDWSDWFFKRDRVGGGVVHQLGIHGIDLLDHLVGPIRAVSARTATLVPERRLADGRRVAVENPDSAWALHELAKDSFASHEMSMIEIQGCDRFRLEIYGTRGTLWLRSERGPLAVFAPDRFGKDWSTPELPKRPFGYAQHQRWIDGLRGAAPPERTAEAGLRSLLVAEAIARSADEEGRRSPVEPA